MGQSRVPVKGPSRELTGDEPGEKPAGQSEAAKPAPVRESTATSVSPELLERAQAGDHVAFAEIYSLHKRRIYSLCLRMLGNPAEAEDLTQEAFLQLHRKIGTFRGESAFSTWLHRLAINVVLMRLRKKGLQLISLDEAMEPTTEERPGAEALVQMIFHSQGQSTGWPCSGRLVIFRRDTPANIHAARY